MATQDTYPSPEVTGTIHAGKVNRAIMKQTLSFLQGKFQSNLPALKADGSHCKDITCGNAFNSRWPVSGITLNQMYFKLVALGIDPTALAWMVEAPTDTIDGYTRDFGDGQGPRAYESLVKPDATKSDYPPAYQGSTLDFLNHTLNLNVTEEEFGKYVKVRGGNKLLGDNAVTSTTTTTSNDAGVQPEDNPVILPKPDANVDVDPNANANAEVVTSLDDDDANAEYVKAATPLPYVKQYPFKVVVTTAAKAFGINTKRFKELKVEVYEGYAHPAIPSSSPHFVMDHDILYDVLVQWHLHLLDPNPHMESLLPQTQVLCYGPRSTGKSTMIREICAVLNRPFFPCAFGPESVKSQLLGMEDFRSVGKGGNASTWIPGILTIAIMTPGAVFAAEEIFRAPHISTTLNTLLQERILELQDIGLVIPVEETVRFTFLDNTNCGVDDGSGVYHSSTPDWSFVDRLGLAIEFGYLTVGQMSQMLTAKTGAPLELTDEVAKLAKKLRDAAEQQANPQLAPSNRALELWVRHLVLPKQDGLKKFIQIVCKGLTPELTTVLETELNACMDSKMLKDPIKEIERRKAEAKAKAEAMKPAIQAAAAGNGNPQPSVATPDGDPFGNSGFPTS